MSAPEPHANTAIPNRRRRTRAAAPKGTAVGYVRVSTSEQVESGAGLAAQEKKIHDEADARGLTVLHIYRDEGKSGGLAPSKRPGLSDALAAMRNREAGVFIAAKLDRVSRSVQHAAKVLEDAKKEGWQFVACDLGDAADPSGEAHAGMLMVFSQYERRLIAQRTREALAAKKAEGVKLGRPTKVPDEALRLILRSAAAGDSLRQIARDLMLVGIPTGSGKATWHAPQVQRMLDCQRARELAAEMWPNTTRAQA